MKIRALEALLTLFLTLALIGVAEAQKGGGKPGGGGGTPTPYTPVVVNVACDGTGTKLQDALNALNPVANVYEVRVSGVCPENLMIEKFQNLVLISENADARATVGKIYVSDSAHYVDLNKLRIVYRGPEVGFSRSVVARNTRIEINDTEVLCDLAPPALNCRGIDVLYGTGAFYNVTFGGDGWGTNKNFSARRARVFLYNYNREAPDETSQACLAYDSISLSVHSSAFVVQGAECPYLQLTANEGSILGIFVNSNSTVSVSVGDHSKVYVGDNGVSEIRTYEQMVTSTTCGFYSVAIDVTAPNINYCNQTP